MKSVFEYIDYRRFLKDFYEDAKKTRKYFSYRFFALRAGVNAPILLKMVIDGKRNLTRSTIDKFIKGVGLKEKEAVFFRNLVLFNQAKSSLEKQEHYRVLKSMVDMVPQHLVEDDHFDYYDKWYYSAIREGICQHDYKDDWETVAKCIHPQISAQDAKQAAEWLISHGLIAKLENGKYEQTHKAITTRSEVKSMAVRNFNRVMIRLAERSLDDFPVEERYTSGITVGLTKEAYDIIVSEIEGFRDRVVKIVDSLEVSDGVYQLNIQMFPLMRSPRIKDKDNRQS
jgi:uncharacterized protein (TIGR02147 family)